MQTLIIEKSTDNGATWVEVEVDDYGTIVELDNLVYKFRTTAMYRVTVTDEFRTGTVTFTENGATATISKNGGEAAPYTSGTPVTEDGSYTVVVTDKAGNVSEASFAIDKTVDFKVNVNNGGLANSVTVTENEKLEIVVTKNGEVIEYKGGNAITEPADYTVKLTDKLGNTAEVKFTIVEPLVQKFDREIDSIPNFEKVLVNGTEVTLDRGALVLAEDGTYEVSIVAGGVANNFTVTVDATAPTLTLGGVENGGTTTEGVIISDVTDGTVKVFLNDEEIEYTAGDELSEVGEYKVIVTDACGNAAEYSFTIEKGANIGIIILIVVIVLAAIGGGVFFYIKKKNSL